MSWESRNRLLPTGERLSSEGWRRDEDSGGRRPADGSDPMEGSSIVGGSIFKPSPNGRGLCKGDRTNLPDTEDELDCCDKGEFGDRSGDSCMKIGEDVGADGDASGSKIISSPLDESSERGDWRGWS